MNARRSLRTLLAAALVFALVAVPVAPAIAGEPVVAAGVTFWAVSLAGMTADEASATIAATRPVSSFPALSAEADGHSWSLTPSDFVTLDVAGTVADAMAAPASTSLGGRYSVGAPAVTAFVDGAAVAVNRGYTDSTRVVSNRRLTITASSDGIALDRAGSASLVTAKLLEQFAGSAVGTISLPFTVIPAHVTAANIGKTIIVVRGKFHVDLYNGAALEKRYHCAVGMNAYPTPLGKFKVIKKVKKPTWHNPFSSWSKGMPSHINGGFYAPLGLRALYLSAPGIRIHGTSKSYSIGHKASHGCIRLTNKNVVNLYPRVPVGTPVYIVK